MTRGQMGVVSMKPRVRFLLLLVFSLVSMVIVAPSQSPKKRQPRRSTQTDPPPVIFSIELDAPSTAAGVRENPKVEVTIENTGDMDICHVSGADRDFYLVVRDSSENEVARTPCHLGNGSSFCALLHPGNSIQGSALLNKEFQLDKPGDYTVQAIRQSSTTSFIKSNIVAITITP
jgi:hypothetical protein